jgi:HSP20 family protein
MRPAPRAGVVAGIRFAAIGPESDREASMASTGRSSQGSGAGSRAGSGGARGTSGARGASGAAGASGASGARGSQAGGRGASARDASLNASATASGGPGGINIGGSAGVSGGPGGVSGSAGISGSAGSAGSAGSTGMRRGGAAGTGVGTGPGAAGAQSQGQGIGGQSGASRMDSEREVPIGREGQQQSRAAGRGQTSAQGSAQPGAQGGAQGYGTPFAFMRRFGEEMDRLFSDFGFGPPGIESQLSLLGWPGSSGRSSLSLNANVPRSGASGGSEGRSEVAGSGSGAVSRPRSSNALASRSSWMPQVEVLQRGNDLVLRADLPGLRREDVHVEIEDDVLTISGERRYESESEEEGLYHSERSYGRFSRSIPLPPGTEGEACEARFTDGVLEVRVPLPQEQQPRGRRIEIR